MSLIAWRETTTWHPVDTALPDTDTTVLIYAPDSDPPVWLGYLDGSIWFTAEGLEIAVTAWAEMPEGPQESAEATFHLGDILSITTGRLVSPERMDGIYSLLCFLVGGAVYTHEIPDLVERYRPILLAQHPQLNELDGYGITRNNCAAWLIEQVKEFGERLIVQRPA